MLQLGIVVNNNLSQTLDIFQVGRGNRNEKIRTYNYPQDRVTEHREGGGTQHNLKTFMEGGEQLEKLQENLIREQRYQDVMENIKDFTKEVQETDGKAKVV